MYLVSAIAMERNPGYTTKTSQVRPASKINTETTPSSQGITESQKFGRYRRWTAHCQLIVYSLPVPVRSGDKIGSNNRCCNTSVLDQRSNFQLIEGIPYSLKIDCQSYRVNGNFTVFLTSSLHVALFEDSKFPSFLGIYGCFITSVSRGVFGKPLKSLNHQENMSVQ